MEIQEASLDQREEIMDFYTMMCRELEKKDFLPKGYKGGFPSLSMVTQAIEAHELYVGVEDGKIVAAYILNHEADAVYDSARWQKALPRDQVSILHALRVSPEHSGKGYASKLVEHSVEMARQKAQKSIRLDCIEGNHIPHKMYRDRGFVYVDTVEITYEDIGEPRKFLLFERLL